MSLLTNRSYHKTWGLSGTDEVTRIAGRLMKGKTFDMLLLFGEIIACQTCSRSLMLRAGGALTSS